MIKETGYSLTRKFFDFAFENERFVKTVHIAVYCWCVELNNRLGWKDEFQLPTDEGMKMTGIRDRHTFIKAIKELTEMGAIKVIQESKSQYVARYITLKNCILNSNGCLDTMLCRVEKSHSKEDISHVEISHDTPPGTPPGTPPSNSTKDKQVNNKTNKPKTISEASLSDGIYPACMDLYNKFIIERTGLGAKINSKSGIAMKKTISYLKTQVHKKENLSEEVPKALEYIFNHYELWQPFHQGQLDLNQIESNLINIINSIKNGKPTTGKQPQSKYAPAT